MQKRVGIDVDDVLADFVSEFVRICHELFGTPLDLKPIDWGWSNFGLTEAQINEAWQRVRATPWFWDKLNVVEGASFKAMQWLMFYGNKLFFITKRFDTGQVTAENQTAKWLRNAFGITFPIVIANTEKGITAKALDLTHFIDDRPENCTAVLEHVPTCQVFIKTTSHNTNFSHPQITRVGSFDEFAKIVGDQI